MGGCANAREASHAACRVAHEAAAIWSRAAGAALTDFTSLFAVMWKIWLGDRDARAFGATLLLVLIRPDGGAALFQLGDGLVAWLMKDGSFHQLQAHETGFGNLTSGVGEAGNPAVWRHASIKADSDWRAILTATDGVADDLRKETLPAFVSLLADEATTNGIEKTRDWLRSEFRNWPTPKHLDDKTLGLCWRAPSND